MKLLRFIVFLAVIAGVVWAFGSERPIELGGSSSGQSIQKECPRCQGKAVIAGATKNCQTCKGSGKTEWNLKENIDIGLRRQGPDCSACKGSGKVSVPNTCPQCMGVGTIDKQSASLHEGLSVVEKLLQYIGIEPATNPKPYQSLFNSSVPLVEAFTRDQSSGPSYSFSNWEKVEPVGDRWSVVVLMTLEGGAQTKKMNRRFFVKNREVVGSEIINPI